MLIRACEIAVFVCLRIPSLGNHLRLLNADACSKKFCQHLIKLDFQKKNWLIRIRCKTIIISISIHFHHIMVTNSIDFHQVASCSGVVPATTAWPRNSEHSTPQPLVTGAQASMTLAHRWPRGLAFDPSLGAFTGASEKLMIWVSVSWETSRLTVVSNQV